MTTAETVAKALQELRADPYGYTQEELRSMHEDLDAALLIVLRGIAEITKE